MLACNFTQKRVKRDAGYGLELLVTKLVQTRESRCLGTKIDNEWLKWMIKMKLWATSPLLTANLKEIISESSFGVNKISSLIRVSTNWFFFFWSFLSQTWPRFSRCKTFSLLIIANRLFACLLIRAPFFLQANMSQKKKLNPRRGVFRTISDIYDGAFLQK